MLEKLLDYEHDLFLALNGSDSIFLDQFMWLFSGKIVWYPVAILLIIILLYRKGWKECLFIVLAITLVVTLCDQFASGICKPAFERFRPTRHPEFMDQVQLVFGYRGGGQFGFMSSHAANAFGFATFMAYLFRHPLFSFVVIIWASITSYSRIYLGVHFISDVIPGMLAGILIGFAVYRLYKWSRQRLILRENECPYPSNNYTRQQKILAASGLLATMLVLVIFDGVLTSLLR